MIGLEKKKNSQLSPESFLRLFNISILFIYLFLPCKLNK